VTFLPPTGGPVWLASRSPRRRLLLDQAGVTVRVHPAAIDDGVLRPSAVDPAHWVAALAYLKGRWVADELHAAGHRLGTVLAADTVCVHEGRILGQPVDAADARGMLRAMRDATHVTMTGVGLISLASGERWLLVDRAAVTWGRVTDEQIERYVSSEQWRGKAGAYNLNERIDDGWPIECRDDPATVMGLPMRRLGPWFQILGGDGP
jgi:septum formation protein